MRASGLLRRAVTEASGSGHGAAPPKSKSSRYPALPPGWTAIIGIETHAQLCPDPLAAGSSTSGPAGSKLFSDARLVPSGSFGPSASLAASDSVQPNSLVTPFDAAYPGTLPRRLRIQGGKQKEQSGPIHQAVRTAVALRCQHIDSSSTFDRKHYFYPDLTSGYQITQKYKPLAKEGRLSLRFEDGHLPNKDEEVDVKIECIQLEQDTAKSTYGQKSMTDSGSASTLDQTMIDLNRSGAGLMEIVSGPDLRTPDQAGAYIRKLQETLRAIGTSDGNMDEGSLRCDVNVSVFRPHLNEPWGTRTEIKNLNSAKFVMQAISHETHRQVALIEQQESQQASASLMTSVPRSKIIEQETRGFDEKTGVTYRLRSKEEAPDYRFMPDPNLPPLQLNDNYLESVQASLPELPEDTRERLVKSYNLTTREANVLIRASDLVFVPIKPPRTPRTAVEYFEALAALVKPKVAINWTINELMKCLNAHGLAFAACPISPAQLAELLNLVETRAITNTVAKSLLPELVTEPELLQPSLKALLESRGLIAEPSSSESSEKGRDGVEALCSAIIQDFPTEAKLIREGKHKIVMKLVGEAMRRTKGTADAVLVRDVLLQQLTS
ncbi:hypothetical protein OC845_005167 [Tilletia horrida]|nr:hypothetical protein OC845_005167 [Tilletia horrida]